MTLRVLHPGFEEADDRPAAVAPLASLAGRTVGLLDNGKLNVGTLLDHVEDLLRTKHDVGTVRRFGKPDASRPAPADVLREMQTCDAVISAVGD